MKASLLTAGFVALTCVLAPPADAKGCIRGAVVGGVAGHYAGRHTYVGALGGCLVGRRLAAQKQRDAEAAAAQRAQPGQGYNGGAYTRSGPGAQPAPSYNGGYTGGAYNRSAPAPSDAPASTYNGGAYQR